MYCPLFALLLNQLFLYGGLVASSFHEGSRKRLWADRPQIDQEASLEAGID
jgi:hypothetical protein